MGQFKGKYAGVNLIGSVMFKLNKKVEYAIIALAAHASLR